MDDLLNKINNLIDSSMENSSDETKLQMRILKGNIKTLFDEANINTGSVQPMNFEPEQVNIPTEPVITQEENNNIPTEPVITQEENNNIPFEPEIVQEVQDNNSNETLEPIESQPVDNNVEQATPIEEAPVQASTGSGKKILIVDDSSIIRNYLEKLCKDKYSITMASGGVEAINLLGSETFDLMLLDLMMPGVDGFGVLDYVKGNSVFIPTIIISGDTTKESIDRAFTYNVVDMIEKPFSETTIMGKIDRILE